MLKNVCIIFVFLVLSPVGLSVDDENNAWQIKSKKESPFSARASLIRYWESKITNDLTKPWFFLNKASPLTAVDLATFYQQLAGNKSQAFCSKANLLCAHITKKPAITGEKHDDDVDFSTYVDKDFNNYGSARLGGTDFFRSYAGSNAPAENFRHYSRNSVSHNDTFQNYSPETNQANGIFTSYGTTAAGGVGEFRNYQNGVNIPLLNFKSYSSDADGRNQGFTSYSGEANSGEQDFQSYARDSNGAENDFAAYSNSSNVVVSSFSSYGETGNGITDTFTKYGSDSNGPRSRFSGYGSGGNSATEVFRSYSDGANVGESSFRLYARDSSSGSAEFESYGQGANQGPARFVNYGETAKANKVGFNIYTDNHAFQKYAKSDVDFNNYLNGSASVNASVASKKWVEPGKFFRESMLKSGARMPMPDIRDKMPKRSFLPRVIASKIPLSLGGFGRIREMFRAGRDGYGMTRIIADALNECERAPSPGETKRCVGSGEDMIDFATSVLGRNVTVRTTESTRGSNGEILIGSVRGINGGKITKSVSCHQNLFPFLLYYCHSVPKVRVYEAEILDLNSKAKINLGVAICHVDTTSWSSGHGAFVALGLGPGKIEVCHWIFENDMTWVVAY